MVEIKIRANEENDGKVLDRKFNTKVDCKIKATPDNVADVLCELENCVVDIIERFQKVYNETDFSLGIMFATNLIDDFTKHKD